MGYLLHDGSETDVGNQVTNGTFGSDLSGWDAGTGWSWSSGKALYDGTPASELVVNGSFTGSAASWTLGSQWTYGSNHVTRTGGGFGSTADNSVYQTIGGLVVGQWYQVTFTCVVPSGFLFVTLGDQNSGPYYATASSGTYTVYLKCIQTKINFFASTFGGPLIQVDDVSVKATTLSQNFTAAFGNSYRFSVDVGGTTGSVSWYDYAGFLRGTYSAGSGTNTVELSTFNGAVVFAPTADFDGTVDNVSLDPLTFFTEPLEQDLTGLSGDYKVSVNMISGTQGYISFAVGSSSTSFQASDHGTLSDTLTGLSGDLRVIITPLQNLNGELHFDGSFTSISVKKDLGGGSFGPELITNSSITTNWEDFYEYDPEGPRFPAPGWAFTDTTISTPLTQENVPMTNGVTYRLRFSAIGQGEADTITASVGTSYTGTFGPPFDGYYSDTFVFDGGDNTLTFTVTSDNASVRFGSIREVITAQTDDNRDVHEFLNGTTDTGREIFFRADTQQIQLMSEFETFANPLAIITKLQRGSLVKCFVAFEQGDFYELEGNATKGVSIIKVHSKDKKSIVTPPIARSIRISWRDSSQQICRLTQGGIVFLPTTMSYAQGTPEASAGRGIPD